MLILVLINVQVVLMKGLQKGFLGVLWWILMVRLLPLALPSIGSLVQQSRPVINLELVSHKQDHLPRLHIFFEEFVFFDRL